MGRTISRLALQLDPYANWLLAVGLAAALAINGRLWLRDRQAGRRLRGQAIVMPHCPDPLPRVSLLLPAWNEADHLAACLDSILALRYPDKEVILCAGGEDGTLEIARRYAGPGVIVLEQSPGEGKQGALRRCFARSSGEVVFLTDADCRLDDRSFEATLAPLLCGEEAAATGFWQPLYAQQADPFVQFQWSFHLYREAGLPDYSATLDGRNAAVKRCILEVSGAFQAAAPTGTDYVLSKELTCRGYRIRTVRKSRVQTEYPDRFSPYLRQQSRWFRNRLLHGLRYRDWEGIASHLQAGLPAVFMLASPLLGGLRSRLLRSAWLGALAHLALSQARLIGFVFISGERPFGSAWRWPLFFPYNLVSWIAMACGLLDSLLPARRSRW